MQVEFNDSTTTLICTSSNMAADTSITLLCHVAAQKEFQSWKACVQYSLGKGCSNIPYQLELVVLKQECSGSSTWTAHVPLSGMSTVWVLRMVFILRTENKMEEEITNYSQSSWMNMLIHKHSMFTTSLTRTSYLHSTETSHDFMSLFLALFTLSLYECSNRTARVHGLQATLLANNPG